MGYGVLEGDDEPRMIACGVLTAPSSMPLARRLSQLYQGLEEIIARYQPGEVAVEEPFVAQNARTALVVGRAQAVAILAAANKGLPLYYYAPLKVKQMVADYGGSSKEQVQEMVRLQLGLSELPRSDAADALAVALCHLRQSHLSKLLSSRSS